MPYPTSGNGSPKGPTRVRLQPRATNASDDGMLVSDACAVVLIVGRALAMGDKPRTGVPQPAPKAVAEAAVPEELPSHSQVSPIAGPFSPPNSTVRPRWLSYAIAW